MTTETIALHYLELAELASRIEAREISPLTATRAQLDRIALLDGELGSYARVTADVAMAQAERAEAEIAAGNYRGPLHGVPIAVKDLFWTKGIVTAAGGTVHRDHVPDEDATVVRRLREAGAILLGKLQLTEGAYSDHHPSIAAPKNPWNTDYWTGISSSGPGVAIAAGLCYGALASDTGGSIRWPSAANGVTGLKPTWGRVSRHGMFALAPSMDHVGPMARSAVDIAVLLQAITGADPSDPTASSEAAPDYLATAKQSARGLRIGVDPVWNSVDVDAETQAAISHVLEVLGSLGGAIREVTFPDVTRAVADWPVQCALEAAVVHQATYPARKSEYGPVLADVLEAGRRVSSVDDAELSRRRDAFTRSVSAGLETIDVLVIPVHPLGPPSLSMIQTLGEHPELIAELQRYTCPFDLTGHPTITLPAAFAANGMPIGIQLVSARGGEGTLIRAAAAFQSVTSWHRRHPEI